MLSRTLRLLVRADLETLWVALMERTENPERYRVGITELHISSRENNHFIRETVVHGHSVKERIMIDPENRAVIEEISEHPSFNGVIGWKLVPTARQSPVAPVYLECHIELQPKARVVTGVVRGEEETLTDVQRELNQIRDHAEGKFSNPFATEPI